MKAITPRPSTAILVGAAAMMSLGMGMRQSLGLFLPPMTETLAIKAADFTFAVAVQNIVWGLCQTPVGIIADRFGLRPAMIGGTLFYLAGLIVMTNATGPTGLAVAGGLIGVALACTASSLAMTACARTVPEDRRSTMLGVVGAFASVGTMIIAPVVQEILARFNWHAGMWLFMVLAVLMIPAAFAAGGADRLPTPRHAHVPMRQVLAEAFRHRRFIVMSMSYFVCGLTLVFLTTHLPNYLAVCGQDPMLGATALSIIGGVNTIGSWFAGWLGQRFPKHILLGLIYILRAITLTAFFIVPPTETSVLVFAAVMGMLWLGVIPLVSGLVAEMFGTRYMATLLGISFVLHQVGSFIGAWGGGLIFDALGSYDVAWRVGVFIGLLAGVAQMLFGGPARPAPMRPIPATA